MSVHPAARVTDLFGHDAGLEGLIAGLADGAVIAIGIVATGGLGAVAVGAALATTGGAGLAGAMIGRTVDGPASGQLATGSANVMVNRLPATMIYLASGDCSHHGSTPPRPAPPRVAGSETVRVNGRTAARITELMDCDAAIRTGSPNVNIGGPRESAVCSALRSDAAKLAQFATDAAAAEAAYSRRKRVLPRRAITMRHRRN